MADQPLLRLPLYVAIAIAIVAAVYLGNAVGKSDIQFLAQVIGGVLLVVWLVLARDYWWFPMAFGLGIGGFFTVPFKIYPHEFALVLSVAALIPQMVLHRRRMKANRDHLSIFFYAVGFYLLIHYAFCVYEYRSTGAGNVSRAYMNALWPFIFGYYFWRFGSTRLLRAALRVIYIAAFIRMGFGLFNYFAGKTYVVPGINYAIDPQDLRASGQILLALALVFAMGRGNTIVRFLNSLMVILASWVVLLGGSRGGAATLLFIPCFALFVFRRWVALWSTLLCAVLVIIALNAYPKSVESLPYNVSRSLSILLIHEKLDIQEETRASTEWHVEALPSEGYKRWSRNLKTELFGTAIKPFRPVLIMYSDYRQWLYRMAEASADMGSYESGFWTVLTVLGAVGLVLYLTLLLWLLKRLLPKLMTRRERDTTWGSLFWACLAITSWIVFSVRVGSYPSFEIFLGLLALAAVRDEQMRQVAEKEQSVAHPIRRPLLATPRPA